MPAFLMLDSFGGNIHPQRLSEGANADPVYQQTFLPSNTNKPAPQTHFSAPCTLPGHAGSANTSAYTGPDALILRSVSSARPSAVTKLVLDSKSLNRPG